MGKGGLLMINMERGGLAKKGGWAILKFEGGIEMKEGGGHFEEGGSDPMHTMYIYVNISFNM